MTQTTHHQFKTLVEVLDHAHKTDRITAPHYAVLKKLLLDGAVYIVAAIVIKHMPYTVVNDDHYIVPIQKRTRKG